MNGSLGLVAAILHLCILLEAMIYVRSVIGKMIFISSITPEAGDGANEISLKEAQRNFIEIGGGHWQWKTWVRNPLKEGDKRSSLATIV